jgi:hypothetical protein
MTSDSQLSKEITDESRRKVIKVGALTAGGIALAATAVGGGLAVLRPSSAEAITKSNRSLSDILSALVQEKVIQPYHTVNTQYIKANSSVSLKQEVPRGLVTLIRENRLSVDVDHGLAMRILIDGSEVISDPDVVQSRYQAPLEFLNSSSFFPVRESFVIELKNKTSRQRYFSSMQTGANIMASQWDSVIVPYLSNIVKEVR